MINSKIIYFHARFIERELFFVLQCGLVLVDSPGIGENPVMDGVIQRFVANNQINGFIYLIKSDSGSRVDEDRVRKFPIILRLTLHNNYWHHLKKVIEE